jgi:cytochrome c oxidase subunit 2
MNSEFTLFPEQASTAAPQVDALFLFIIGVSLFFATITAVLVIYFSIRYRRRSEGQFPPPVHGSTRLETLVVGSMLALFLFMFCWAAYLYLHMMRPPDDAMEVYVVGKQWMWHVQHPVGGQREINELHVPVGKPVKLIMTSEDVIHSFFIPAFRVKQDVLPGRFTYLWFQPTKPGDYHLFCAQYCGTQHSRMGGWIHVMEEGEYRKWLDGQADLSMALRGRQLFLKYQCIACHSGDSQARAPLLEDLYLKDVTLTDGSVKQADEEYIRHHIRGPRDEVVTPYKPVMPIFGPDQMDDEELGQLVEFIKNLHRDQTPKRNEVTPAPEQRSEQTK